MDAEKPRAEKKRKFGGAQEGAGRPAFVPSDEERKLVKELSGLGLPQAQIRMLVRGGIALETLLAHFRVELDEGKAKTSWDIANALYSKALKGDVTAMIWWTKTQMRWSETQKIEVTGKEGGPIQTVDFSKLSTEALLELSKAIQDATPATDDHDGRSRPH